jgi:hypothetical protein
MKEKGEGGKKQKLLPKSKMATVTATSSHAGSAATSLKAPIVPAQSKLFKPLKVGKMELKHRIVFPPLT